MTADSGMTETEAKAWLSARGWMSGDAGSRLEWLAQEVLAEADRQNLISAGTRPFLWARHIVDSAQLLECLPDNATDGLWLDIGTGAGFPGLVVASLSNRPMLLVEPRPLRVAHLERCIAAMGLTHCRVARASIAAIDGEERPAIISARAYAPLERIFASARHLANLSTCWMLPKGRSAEKELVTARQEWQGVFHVKQSATDPESRIIVASGVERRRIAPRQAPSGQFSRRGRRAQP